MPISGAPGVPLVGARVTFLESKYPQLTRSKNGDSMDNAEALRFLTENGPLHASQLGEKVWKLQRPKSAYGKLEGHHRLTVNQANEVLVQMQASVLAGPYVGGGWTNEPLRPAARRTVDLRAGPRSLPKSRSSHHNFRLPTPIPDAKRLKVAADVMLVQSPQRSRPGERGEGEDIVEEMKRRAKNGTWVTKREQSKRERRPHTASFGRNSKEGITDYNKDAMARVDQRQIPARLSVMYRCLNYYQ